MFGCSLTDHLFCSLGIIRLGRLDWTQKKKLVLKSFFNLTIIWLLFQAFYFRFTLLTLIISIFLLLILFIDITFFNHWLGLQAHIFNQMYVIVKSTLLF